MILFFGKRSDSPCSDCSGEQCTMNCGPGTLHRDDIARLREYNVTINLLEAAKIGASPALRRALNREIARWRTTAAFVEERAAK